MSMHWYVVTEKNFEEFKKRFADENGELVYFESGWTYPHVNPLGLEVVQTSHAWSSAPLDDVSLGVR